MEKKARACYPINDVIAKRWSPRAFDPRKIPGKEFILSLLEAGRWAPSAYNEQPWRFIVACRDEVDEFAQLLSCLVEANQRWAKNASLLLLACAQTQFDHNGKENPYAVFDLGLAVENILLETTSKGLFGHVMAGFDADKARTLYAIPEAVKPVVMVAIGYRASCSTLPEDLQETEALLRERKQVYEFTFRRQFGDNTGI